MKKKKSWLLILTAVCSICIFTACGNSEKSVDAGAKEEVSSEDKESSGKKESAEPTPTATPTETPVQMIAAQPKETAAEQLPDKTPGGIGVEAVEKQYRVIAGVNVRSDANTESDILGGLFTGDIVQATGVCENGWIRIKYNGNIGYAYGNCLSESSSGTQTIQ